MYKIRVQKYLSNRVVKGKDRPPEMCLSRSHITFWDYNVAVVYFYNSIMLRKSKDSGFCEKLSPFTSTKFVHLYLKS